MPLHFVRKYPLSCFLFAAIWYLSLFFMAPETPLNSIKLIDKWIHFIMYGGTCSVLWIEYIPGVLYRDTQRRLARPDGQCHWRHIRSRIRTDTISNQEKEISNGLFPRGIGILTQVTIVITTVSCHFLSDEIGLFERFIF